MSQAVEPIKVLCVDDSEDVASLIHLSISAEPDMQSLGFECDVNNVLTKAIESQPDVMVMDLTMPGRDSLEVLREVAAALPGVKTIVFSGYDDADSKDRAWKAGAWGYVSKHGDMQELLEAIRRVANGKPAVSS